MSISDRLDETAERAARVIGSVMSRWDMDGRPDVDGGIDTLIARALAEAGLLAPAPLREEWGSEVRDARPDRDPYVLYARDLDNAQWQIEHNPEWATGRIMHRYRTAWLPVDAIERATTPQEGS